MTDDAPTPEQMAELTARAADEPKGDQIEGDDE